MKIMKKHELPDGGVYIVTDVSKNEDYNNPDITYLDDMEEKCWELFKEYSEFVGVVFLDVKSDQNSYIAKTIQDKIIELVEESFGIKFPLSKG